MCSIMIQLLKKFRLLLGILIISYEMVKYGCIAIDTVKSIAKRNADGDARNMSEGYFERNGTSFTTNCEVMIDYVEGANCVNSRKKVPSAWIELATDFAGEDLKVYVSCLMVRFLSGMKGKGFYGRRSRRYLALGIPRIIKNDYCYISRSDCKVNSTVSHDQGVDFINFFFDGHCFSGESFRMTKGIKLIKSIKVLDKLYMDMDIQNSKYITRLSTELNILVQKAISGVTRKKRSLAKFNRDIKLAMRFGRNITNEDFKVCNPRKDAYNGWFLHNWNAGTSNCISATNYCPGWGTITLDYDNCGCDPPHLWKQKRILRNAQLFCGSKFLNLVALHFQGNVSTVASLAMKRQMLMSELTEDYGFDNKSRQFFIGSRIIMDDDTFGIIASKFKTLKKENFLSVKSIVDSSIQMWKTIDLNTISSRIFVNENEIDKIEESFKYKHKKWGNVTIHDLIKGNEEEIKRVKRDLDKVLNSSTSNEENGMNKTEEDLVKQNCSCNENTTKLLKKLEDDFTKLKVEFDKLKKNLSDVDNMKMKIIMLEKQNKIIIKHEEILEKEFHLFGHSKRRLIDAVIVITFFNLIIVILTILALIANFLRSKGD